MLPDQFSTARLIFAPIVAEDAPLIFEAYARDSEVSRYMTWRPHTALAETEAYVASALAGPSCSYLLRDRGDGRLHGAFELRQPAAHRLGYGYLLARPSWGLGLMSEALTAVVDWALDQPGIRRIGDVCDVENLGSARVMEKAGLTREALLRLWAVHPNISDEPRDCFSYVKTR
ncbi:GNAT family N-acetyltransferase [Bosea sp. 2KB_26]|uniref:GNAT family N-acetyltransferase n=1 Tax=Bosea sp. 2KB_26 TaxID=3237475 RepID=UPI0013B0110A